jgi:hypothetical protein
LFNGIGHDRKARIATKNDRSECENQSFAATRADGEVAPILLKKSVLAVLVDGGIELVDGARRVSASAS